MHEFGYDFIQMGEMTLRQLHFLGSWLNEDTERTRKAQRSASRRRRRR